LRGPNAPFEKMCVLLEEAYVVDAVVHAMNPGHAFKEAFAGLTIISGS
jgi:hypothetical protein